MFHLHIERIIEMLHVMNSQAEVVQSMPLRILPVNILQNMKPSYSDKCEKFAHYFTEDVHNYLPAFNSRSFSN